MNLQKLHENENKTSPSLAELSGLFTPLPQIWRVLCLIQAGREMTETK